MYEYLKMLQPAAEQIGEITEVSMTEDCKIFGKRVHIEGVDEDGREFTLELKIKKEQEPDVS